jgi:hypothetical protein
MKVRKPHPPWPSQCSLDYICITFNNHRQLTIPKPCLVPLREACRQGRIFSMAVWGLGGPGDHVGRVGHVSPYTPYSNKT